MAYDDETLRALVNKPQEALAIEIKRWIDPSSPEGIAKIAKACIALRNNNGGYLIIGLDDQSHTPDAQNAPQDVKTAFHADIIQAIVAKYASEAFEIEVRFVEREGQEYPVICVPDGVKVIVAAKSDLRLPSGEIVIAANRIYVRSLNANNTVSTTEAKWNDWGRLIDICFDNREADIGRFIRRHLGQVEVANLKEMLSSLASVSPEPESDMGKVTLYLQEGETCFAQLVEKRDLSLPPHGTWEVAFVINGKIKSYRANETFLNLISSSNPRYTGWPLWVDSRNFTIEDSKPHIMNGAWQALIVSLSSDWLSAIDYWRAHPAGHFYHRRAFDDDIPRGGRSPQPLTVLDFTIPISLVAEAIVTGISFAKSMGCEEGQCELKFAFRWKGLTGRMLTSWVDPRRRLWFSKVTEQDTVTSQVSIQIDVPISALFQKVHEATAPLFELFDGFELSPQVTEDLTNDLLRRR